MIKSAVTQIWKPAGLERRGKEVKLWLNAAMDDTCAPRDVVQKGEVSVLFDDPDIRSSKKNAAVEVVPLSSALFGLLALSLTCAACAM